jgi:hypothetical protein
MFKPLTRSPKNADGPNAGFAETTFLHTAGDDDYSGFAPTEMFDEADVGIERSNGEPMTAEATRAAASTSHTALERAASAPVAFEAPAPDDEPHMPQSWVTSQWVAAQEAKAHEAADQARAVIAAQRRAEEQAEAAQATEPAPAAPLKGLARLRAAFDRLLPGEFRSLLPLFIGVTVTMAMISAVLPLFDKP